MNGVKTQGNRISGCGWEGGGFPEEGWMRSEAPIGAKQSGGRWNTFHRRNISLFSVEYTWLWLEVWTLHLEEKSVSAHSGQGMYKKPVLWVATGTVLISGHPCDSSGLHGDFSSDFAPMALDLALARHQNASCGKAVVLQRWNSNRPNFSRKEVKI